MSEMVIGPAGLDDVAALAVLLAEMARFYGAEHAEPEDERERQIREALFGEPGGGHALLARDGGRLAGFAAYTFLWPAVGLTRSLYLKELYVAQAYRGRGVGRLLMAALFEIAAERGCSRVEWTADRDNVGAMEFYARLGVPVRESKVFYRAQDSGTGFLAFS
ncbi:MAG TPA: GNAT family N-acetyltransferase [Streptosporangiaceae bacterium]|nr:GNAT family N-acetyltransferase [Streptosporangiaceae bacterium]